MTGPDSGAPPRRTGRLAIVAAVIAVLAGGSIPLLRRAQDALERETITLDARRVASRATLDSLAAIQAREDTTLARERARAAARVEAGLHLVIAADSGTVALMRDGIALRTMPARFRGRRPAPGVQTIRSMVESAPQVSAATVDSLGNAIKAAPQERTVERIVLSDGTSLEGGDAAAALLGGVDPSGPPAILVSRRDFAAIRPNLVRGMKAVVF